MGVRPPPVVTPSTLLLQSKPARLPKVRRCDGGAESRRRRNAGQCVYEPATAATHEHDVAEGWEADTGQLTHEHHKRELF
jgi:hypothetical protein